MIDIIQLIVEIVSAVLSFILVWFMYKPYGLTREERYLGLPLGFAFLGISEVFLGFGILETFEEARVLSLITRTFAYVFLAATYLFQNKLTKSNRIIWSVTFSLIIIALAAFSLFMIDGSIVGLELPANPSFYFRVLALICITYICLVTLRKHIRVPDKDTLWIPFGFILLGISQYSSLIWATDANYTYGIAFSGGWIARITGLCIFFVVSYLTLYKRNGKINENNSA